MGRGLSRRWVRHCLRRWVAEQESIETRMLSLVDVLLADQGMDVSTHLRTGEALTGKCLQVVSLSPDSASGLRVWGGAAPCLA